MSINELRAAVTVVSLLLFVGIWIWAWSLRNQAAFQRAALLPLDDESAAPNESGEPRP